jgi:hypothetical protein
MKTKNTEIARAGMKVGAVIGAVAFLIFGVLPGFHYGGYGALMLLTKLAGGPLEMTLGIRMIVLFGVLLGILCLASMSIVLGSVFGTISGYLVGLVSPAETPEAQEEAAKN